MNRVSVSRVGRRDRRHTRPSARRVTFGIRITISQTFHSGALPGPGDATREYQVELELLTSCDHP